MDANRTNVELNCWELNFNSSGSVANPTEVAYAFGYAHEGVVHILFVLQADAAGVVVFAEQADEEGKVNAAPAQLYALVGFGGAILMAFASYGITKGMCRLTRFMVIGIKSAFIRRKRR